MGNNYGNANRRRVMPDRAFRRLSGIHYAILVALEESGRSTPELFAALPGYSQDDIRDAVCYLRNTGCIRRGSADPSAWEVSA